MTKSGVGKTRLESARACRGRVWLAAALLAALGGVVAASLPAFAGPDKQSKEERKWEKAIQEESESPYKKWIEQEVPYIVTDEERQTFKKLSTDDERETFIENFWERRNPNPGNPENEFKEEYYRRIAYANEHYASRIPGWKTDRGCIYIMYGPSNEIDSHPKGGGETSPFAFEDWTYNYIEGIGSNIQLKFVDPTKSGEYHLSMDPGQKGRATARPKSAEATF